MLLSGLKETISPLSSRNGERLKTLRFSDFVVLVLIIYSTWNTPMESNNFNVQEYVNQMSLLLDLPINEEYKDGVIANFEKIKDIAEIVNNFPLPESIEIAPLFEL